MLADAHRLIALLVAFGGGLVVLLVVLGRATNRPLRFALDRAILGAVLLVAVGSVLGLVLLVAGPGPADPLHLLYALAALLVLPIARILDLPPRRQAVAVGIGAVILAILVLRLFQTG